MTEWKFPVKRYHEQDGVYLGWHPGYALSVCRVLVWEADCITGVAEGHLFVFSELIFMILSSSEPCVVSQAVLEEMGEGLLRLEGIKKHKNRGKQLSKREHRVFKGSPCRLLELESSGNFLLGSISDEIFCGSTTPCVDTAFRRRGALHGSF